MVIAIENTTTTIYQFAAVLMRRLLKRIFCTNMS